MHDNATSDSLAAIGDQIRRLRKAKGLTLAGLAELAGTSAPAMHRYENGWDRFELTTLRKIASALGARLEVRLVQDSELDLSLPHDRSGLLALLAPLFWDHELEEADLDRYPSWVLGRVLMFGDVPQVRASRAFYGDEAIKEAIQRREIDARTRNYWNLTLAE
ncbi:MAG: helix-turn-helix transcriptional regulator [Gemmatimonadota bacterium]|jgi:transcriptional regulator with XRE-family HTH domain